MHTSVHHGLMCGKEQGLVLCNSVHFDLISKLLLHTSLWLLLESKHFGLMLVWPELLYPAMMSDSVIGHDA